MFNATLPVECHPYDISYPERLAILGLQPLDVRRIRLDLRMHYKIFNGLVATSKTDHFKYSNPTSLFTRSCGPKLVEPTSHLNKIDNIFLLSVTPLHT